MTSWDRAIRRRHLRALLIAQARAGGCTCEPDVILPKIESGKVRVATLRHDNDCPHAVGPPEHGDLAARINRGEYDS